jgi:uncharacterized protein (TIGR03086 family)
VDEFTTAEEALIAVHDVVQTIGHNDLHRPTPRRDFDVTALADHLVDTITRLGAAAAIPPAVPHGASIDQRIQQVTEPILAGWRRRGLTGDVVFSGRTLPTHLALDILSLELVVHGWDFAVALHRPLNVSDAHAGHVLGLAQQTLTAQSRATAGFDPPVPVPEDAGTLDQLIAFTGRNPLSMNPKGQVSVQAMTSANLIGRVIDVDGAQLCADERPGRAPALVFLHYWGGSRRTWQPVLTRLHPGQALVAYDQRGWGDSTNAPGPYDMERLADDAQSVIDAFGSTDYVLVGHSMGGKVVQALAARRPAGLAGVVLVAPAPAAPVGSTQQLQQLTIHAYDDEQMVQQSIDRMLTHQPLSVELRKQIVEDSLRAGDEARLAWPKHGLAQDVSAGLSNVDVPVLVLAGGHDKVEPPTVLADHLLPLMPHATMTVLEDTGHLSPLEVPDQVARHITTFTAQLGRGASCSRSQVHEGYGHGWA